MPYLNKEHKLERQRARRNALRIEREAQRAIEKTEGREAKCGRTKQGIKRRSSDTSADECSTTGYVQCVSKLGSDSGTVSIKCDNISFDDTNETCSKLIKLEPTSNTDTDSGLLHTQAQSSHTFHDDNQGQTECKPEIYPTLAENIFGKEGEGGTCTDKSDTDEKLTTIISGNDVQPKRVTFGEESKQAMSRIIKDEQYAEHAVCRDLRHQIMRVAGTLGQRDLRLLLSVALNPTSYRKPDDIDRDNPVVPSTQGKKTNLSVEALIEWKLRQKGTRGATVVDRNPIDEPGDRDCWINERDENGNILFT